MNESGINIEQLAALANLRIEAKEQANFQDEFDEIVRLIDEMLAFDASDLPVTNQVTDLENVFRRDDVVAYPHHRTLVDLTPVHEHDLVRVPGVFHPQDQDHG